MAFSPQATPAPALHQASGAEDVLRSMMEQMVQEAVEREFERFIGAAPWERTPERQGWRNGRKRRRFKTRVGSLELRIPRDREGRFQPSLFERYQRSEKALVLALVEMYVQGVSTRKVSRIVERLCGFSISASQVSALTQNLDADLEAWRTRSLAGLRYPYLVVDAHYEKVRREGRVRSTAVLWVVGISEEGYREHLGVWLGASESRESWGRVFRELTGRGLEGVEYVVSDEHVGLLEAVQRYFPAAEHQRCQVHYLRNALAHAGSEVLGQELKTALKDIWAAPDRDEAEARLARLIDRLEARHPALAEWLEATAQETLGCYALKEPSHRRRLRTTNGIEHDHAEMRRRTRVVRIFPNEASLLRLASALAAERNEQWMERRYMRMDLEQEEQLPLRA